MKNMLLASAAVPALIYALPSQAQECTAAPDCATLGYNQTEANCKGRNYTRCPFDDTKYNCDLAQSSKEVCASMGFIDTMPCSSGEYVSCPGNGMYARCINRAKAGDLKYSVRTDDHDGWLLCDGRSISQTQYPELYSIIGEAFKGKLPNYKGYFLKGAATSGSGPAPSTFNTAEAAGLPNITGVAYAYHYDTFPPSGAFSESVENDNHASFGGKGSENRHVKYTFSASKSNSIYGKSNTVTPANYLANIFIFAGKVTDVCAAAGYQSTTTGYYGCTTTTVSGKTCYKNCKSETIRDQCRTTYYSTIEPSSGSSYYYPGYSSCYNDDIASCTIGGENYKASEITLTKCQAYASDLIKVCRVDDDCMEQNYSVSAEESTDSSESSSSSGSSGSGSTGSGSTSGDPCESVTCTGTQTCHNGRCY